MIVSVPTWQLLAGDRFSPGSHRTVTSVDILKTPARVDFTDGTWMFADKDELWTVTRT